MNARPPLVLLVLAVGAVLLSALFTRDFLSAASHPNGCEMTYSHPIYTQVNISSKTRHSSKYSLYKIDNRKQRKELTGVPVLFLPGNLGSYKQSRSIRRHLWDLDANLFDVFAADFGEELSAVSGLFVQQEASFVNDAIRWILKQYRKKQKSDKKRATQSSVIVVAHSMGAVVAQVAPTLHNHKQGSIEHIVALGSPYYKPPYPFDTDMQYMYEASNQLLASKKPRSSPTSSANVKNALPGGKGVLPDPVVISIAGGHKDTTVHASLSLPDSATSSGNSLAVLSTAMPSVNVSVDHQCLLWCRQLLQSVAESIYAVVDTKHRHLIKSASERLKLATSTLIGDDSDVSIHRNSVMAGYHRLEDVDQYDLWLPLWLYNLFRTRYSTLLLMMYALTLRILQVQISHWQRRFDPQKEPGVGDDIIPSFLSLLHPLQHGPQVIYRIGNWLCPQDNSTPKQSTRQLAIGGGSVTIIALAIAIGYAPPTSDFVDWLRPFGSLAIIYLSAVGLMSATFTMLDPIRQYLLCPLALRLNHAAKKYHVTKWKAIALLYVITQVLGHVEMLVSSEASAEFRGARCMALLVFAALFAVIFSTLRMITDELASLSQQRLQRSFAAVLLFSACAWAGKIAYFIAAARFPPPVLTKAFGIEASICFGVLTLVGYTCALVYEQTLPLPPVAFFGTDSASDISSLYDETPKVGGTRITAENCPRCLYEDAGPGAVFVECSTSKTKRIRMSSGDVVTVGPTYRVVSCDCVFRAKKTADYCAFCLRSCRLCGGGDGNFQQAQKYRQFLDESRVSLLVHAVIPLLMQALALGQLSYGFDKEHLSFYITPTVALVLILYFTLLRDPRDRKYSKRQTARPQPKKASSVSSQQKKARKQRKKRKKKSSASTSQTSGPLLQEITPPPLD